MTEELGAKLYALSLAAVREVDDQLLIGVQTALGLLPINVDPEAAGLEIARNIFPEVEGWHDHYVTPLEIVQGFPLESYRLTWQIEKSD